ncbi:MAG: carbohydrate ABC transporter permease [Eubacteriales bacterium]|jgi:ABC-type glycerol-3-phosphate transport system permease component|nr:carbohydrate ABC transporter permease [Eubacteriales bacterium]MDD4710206.1 carbohydrate ABC transporter permease [Eubacteriales bacterium]
MPTHRRFSLSLVFLLLLMAVSLLPFYIMVSGSLKPSMSFFMVPMDFNPFINLGLSNYRAVLKKVDMFRSFGNSLFITGTTVMITVVISAMSGYVFAKKKFAGKRFWFVVLLVTMMLPRQLLMVPNFMIAHSLNLTDKAFGVILTTVHASYGIFLCKQYMSTLMDEMIEASVIDGCGEVRIFTEIIVPLSTPVFGALAIFTFISCWNDFIWQNIMLTSKGNRTIPLALSYLIGLQDGVSTIGPQMAGATMSMIPILIFFLFFQKYFIKGISMGAVKG